MSYIPAIVRVATGLVGLNLCLAAAARLAADEIEHLPVGVQKDGRIVVPTNQILTPAGKQITFPGRPVDLVLADDGRTLIVKNMRDLVVIDAESAKIKQTLPLPQPAKKDLGFSVVGILARDGKIYASDAQGHVRVAEPGSDGDYQWSDSLQLAEPEVGGHAHPAGLAWPAGGELWCTSTRGNTIGRFDLATKKVVETVKVGVAPYMICAPKKDRLYVTNWGGDPPAAGSPQGVTSKTPVRVDARTGVANEGSVSVVGIDGGQWKQLKTIQVGGHPSGMLASGKGQFVYVANANDDTVSVIDTSSDQVVETISCRPEGRLPFGSGSNALALSPDGETLYVANGTNNCIAVVKLGWLARDVAAGGERASTPRAEPVPPGSRLIGLIPTGWYPGALAISADGKKLFVANVKGPGALSQPRPTPAGKNSRDHLGSVSIIDVPSAEQLAAYTRQVNANNRLAYSLAGLDKPRPNAQTKPIPERHGEPSVFKHVIYIIKENRTYDQVFGDMPEGKGDPRLVIFGEEVTPNHHALARQFTLFDNFYCSGVLSADGHSWTNEAYVTDYLEKSFGGFTRSYPDHGDDPLAYPKTGFLWDNALAHKRTLRNYGEFVNEDPYPKGTTWKQVYDDYKNGTEKVKITVRASLESLASHTHPRFPWFPLLAPDVYRAKMFIEELHEFEKKGELPNLIYLTLPCDHTTGTDPGFPTPKASVADNDLALGQIVEAVTQSRFWPHTCIFVVEDDPQDGFDHVDGHRTVALAISPYTKRKFVDHTSYNQTGMVKTIELILGLPPMNQLDLSATAMRACFQGEPDLSGYSCLPNNIPLDQMNPDLSTLKGEALYWANKSIELNLTEGDKADEGTFNRILWHATRGYDAPYPVEFTNAYREDRDEGDDENADD